MIDLKRPKEEVKKEMTVGPGEPERYPWGLRINLEDHELKALGLNIADYKAGDPISFSAEGDVTEVSVRETEGGKGDRKRMEIQIKKMDFPKAKPSKFSTFHKMQGKGAGE